MSKELIRLLGYHGTKRYFMNAIEKNGFEESSKGWLGKGVYFFQEDYDMAIEWAKKRHNTIMTCFIKRYIEVIDENFFDITWPLDKRTKYYFQERERYVKEMESRGYKIEIDSRKRYEGELVDLICEKKNYLVVRACTYTYKKYDEIYDLNSIFSNGVEICVKDLKCISKGGN